MSNYTVNQLATLAGVSIRTLHHYDQIGLLTPSARSEGNYRLYQRADLLRLQQILFYRELDVPLREIAVLLDAPDFDLCTALESHRRALTKRRDRLADLISTIDNTLASLREERTMLSDEELYEGLSTEEIEAINAEVDEKYDPFLVAESRRRVRTMSKTDFKAVKDEGEEIGAAIAQMMDHDPTRPEVQALIARHHAWIENFYPASAEVYRGLGDLYSTDDRFRAYYDKHKEGLADFLCAAIHHYAAQVLAE